MYGPVLADALKTIYLRNLHAFPSHEWDIDTAEVEEKKWFTIRWYDDRVTSKILYVYFLLRKIVTYVLTASFSPMKQIQRIPRRR